MTDTWAETIDRLYAAGHAPEHNASEAQHAPVAGPASWQPYVAPGAAPEPMSAAPAADPLILELEHALDEHKSGDSATHNLASEHPASPAVLAEAPTAQSAPSPASEPAAEVLPSVYGHAEPADERDAPIQLETPLASEPRLNLETLVTHQAPADLEPAAPDPAPAPLMAPTSAPVETPVSAIAAIQPPVAEPVVAEPPIAEPVVAQPVVAQAEKVVEPFVEPSDPHPVVAPTPEWAPLAAAELSPPERPSLTLTPTVHTTGAHDAIDPVLAGFDHVVALAGYVLLFISVFMFGVPALATMALAYAHKNDSHLLVRSHYRFQLRIFWTAILFALLAIGSAVTAGGMAITTVVDFARAHLPGVGTAMARANVGAWSGEISGLLLVAAVTLGVLGLVWILVASVFGFLRLVANRPIGHQYAAK